jgi:hypothetical protein
MHKKIKAELVSLAHSILQLENNDDVTILHKKARDVYEKLSVLKFVNANLNEMPIAENEETTAEVKEVVVEETVEITKKVEDVPEIVAVEDAAKVIDETVETVEEIVEEVVEEPAKEVVQVVETIKNEVEEAKEIQTKEEVEVNFAIEDDLVENDERDLQTPQFTLEDEFKDAISSDVATALFEKATKENPVVEAPKEIKPRSLNDAIFSANLQVGLNDRIAFVKHLFEGSQEDFNRVLSQLNSFKTEDEAKTFLQEFVKPEYDWSAKQEYEERFMNIIERKFL